MFSSVSFVVCTFVFVPAFETFFTLAFKCSVNMPAFFIISAKQKTGFGLA